MNLVFRVYESWIDEIRVTIRFLDLKFIFRCVDLELVSLRIVEMGYLVLGFVGLAFYGV